MILTIYPYQISKDKQCRYYQKNNRKLCKLANRACKNSYTEKNHIIQSLINSINTMMIYPIVHFKRLGSRHIHKEIEIS